jgi:hypothetical protein
VDAGTGNEQSNWKPEIFSRTKASVRRFIGEECDKGFPDKALDTEAEEGREPPASGP